MTEISPRGTNESQPAAQKPFCGVTPAETLDSWSDALLHHPNVAEFDGLYLPLMLKGVKSVRFSTYGTSWRTRFPHEVEGVARDRALLAARKAFIRATLGYGGEDPSMPKHHSYVAVKPGELRPEHNPSEFGVLLGVASEEIDSAVGEAAVASDYTHTLTPEELCERLGRSELIDTLNQPHIFVTTAWPETEIDELLLPWPEHEEYHRRIQLITDAIAQG
ncbi:MAG TPA: hypothetical protein VIM53_00790 [Candidatus Saccharimonadales bacterium]